eukprot:TRINITY_DN2925_c0_g1_i2.p1 TRINITY_DN2925_c0_g1~~TRINITY_DN2925_c0_g1_i2.p1  ORF type:complete len:1992 (+),score=550.82 TRINITY_DN2925_c0_g1_i2:320-5977(+)
MAEAFPNQIPCGLAEDCTTGSSLIGTEPHTPEMPHPMRALFDLPDELQKDAVGLSSHFQAFKRNVVFAGDNDAVTRKKGLKQLNEMFTFEGADSAIFAEGRVRKGLNFHEEDRQEGSEHVNYHGSRDHRKPELVDEEDINSKIRILQDEVAQLLTENKELKTQVELECEHVHKAEAEVESLHQALSKLQAEEEDAHLQCQQHLERLSNLEADFSSGKEEIERLKDEILMGAMKLNGAEERCLLLDGANQSLQSEVETLVQKMKLQQQELMGNHEELEKLRICIQDEQVHRVQAEEALQSMEHLHSQSQDEKTALRLELQQGLQMLKDMEVIEHALEDEVRQMAEENSILNKQNLSSLALIKNLQDEISSLKEMIGKLEEEAGLHTIQKDALQQELCRLNEEKDDLKMRYQNVMDQVESVGLNATCLQLSVKVLQDENLDLKEICQRNNDEKVALLENLENMEKLSEKNVILERSLSDTTASLEALRATLNTLEEYYQYLQDENLKLKEICQKNNDVKVALIQKLANMEKLTEKNMLLEGSLSDTSAELRGLRTTIMTLEESYLSLQDENLDLKEICQKNNDEKLALLNKLDNMEKLSEKNILLENSLSDTSAKLQMMREAMKTLQESYHSLEDEKLHLKEICQKNNDAKIVLLERLENMEKVVEKNMLLEKLLSDASAEVHGLREYLKTLEESSHSIQDENLHLKEICQKNDSEKLILSQKLESMEKLSEKNMLLEFSLSDTTAKLQEMETELKMLEESFKSLQEEKSDLVTEKDVLVSQAESITQNTKMLSEKNAVLENSLLYTNAEMDGLRSKSSKLEEWCQSLQDEKSSLLAEQDDLVSQVENFRLSLEDLEQRHRELQNQQTGLERDRELTLCHVDKLQVLLNLERQEHANSIQSSKTQRSSLENQMHLLQEEAQRRMEDLEEERVKVINAQIEIFILQRCILDIKERSSSVSIECQKYVDASTQAKNMILELQKENLWQQEKVKSFLEQSNKLKMVIHQVLKVLDICADDGFLDRSEDQVVWLHILERIKRMQSSILDTEDKNKLLAFEKSINIILLDQLRMEINYLKTENYTLEREGEIRNGELSALEAETHKLLEENKRLLLEKRAGSHREEALKNEMEKLDGQFSQLQEAYQLLLDENFKFLDENVSLAKKVSDLKAENHILEEKNDGILGEAMTQANLSLVFESISTEKTLVLKALSADFNCLCAINNNLKNEIGEVIEKMRMVETENLHLKESIERLEEYKSSSLIIEDELNMIRNIYDQLNHQIEIGKNLLSHKEVTLLQVSQELEATQSENAELHKEIEEGRILEEHLEFALQKKINEVELWARENTKLCKEIEEGKNREGHLESELLKRINEIELWEREVASVYEDLNVSVICSSVFKEKAMELSAACESLKGSAMIEKQRSDDERALLNSDIEELKREVSVLEGDNLGLKAEMAAYLPLILSLQKSVSSLEHHALAPAMVLATGNQEVQEAMVAMAHQNDISNQEASEDHRIIAAAGFLELQKLQAKVHDVEKAVIETMAFALQESSDSRAKLKVAVEEIKELEVKSRSVLQETETRKDVILLLEEGRELSKDQELQRIDAEGSQSKRGLTMKDIQLDHVLDPSSRRNSSSGKAHIQVSETDEQMLELWETAERECNFQPIRKLPASATANKDVTEYYQIEVVEEQKSEHPSSELHAEKELAVDNAEVSKKATENSQEENAKIVESLASDAQRLVNLQTSVQELKKKMDKSGKHKRSAAFEYDNIKGQLKEFEEAILHLADINRKLTKNAEDYTASDSMVRESAGKMGTLQKRQVVERVRKSSEKIGRLELEVQRIQFMLLKHEDQHKSKGTRAVNRRKEAALRDYLYGGIRQGKKKVPCCACIKPVTNGE